MRTFHLLALMIPLVFMGCVSPDVNPTATRPGTGYVDFYADDSSELCWEIRRLNPNGGKGKILFENYRPQSNALIRLAFPPGDYRFQVSFLNRAITGSDPLSVTVEDSHITPVSVTLIETGSTVIERKDVSVGGTFYGRGGRSTKMRASEGASFRVQAEPQPSRPYQPKKVLSSAQP